MHSTIFKLVTLTICSLLLREAASFKCNGRANLLQDYNTVCDNRGFQPDITEVQSCLFRARQDSTKECTPTDQCSEVNIKMVSNSAYDASDLNLIWSFSTCFKQMVDVKVCTTPPTGTTTLPPTTTTTVGNTTTSETPTTTTSEMTTTTTTMPTTTTTMPTTTTTAATTTTTTAATTTTTTAATTTTTTAATTTTTTATTTTGTTTTTQPTTTTTPLKMLDGCYEGSVTFNAATCAAESKMVELTHDTTGDMLNFTIEVLGCCNDTTKCKVAAPTSQSRKCQYGTGTDKISNVLCSSDCWAIYEGSTQTTSHGCLSDIDETKYEQYSVSRSQTCSTTYANGRCDTANGVTNCVRCCSSDNCNSWTTQGEFVVTETTTQAKSSTFLPSLGLLIVSLIVAHQ